MTTIGIVMLVVMAIIVAAMAMIATGMGRFDKEAAVRTAASSLPSVLRRMWLARTCSGCWNCAMFCV